VKGKSTFVVLRQHSLHTVQAVKFKSKEDGGESATAVAKFFKTLPLESLVDLHGVMVEAQVSGCTQSTVELQIERAFCVSKASAQLPFLLVDASRAEAEIEESLSTDRPYVRVLPDLRLENRWLDIRVPAHNAILRVQSAVTRLFRESLTKRGFLEIHSPKLIAGESEGGAEVFRTDYFGQQATLAQSPQIYKQMALSSDLPGVFEVGPVFRAENSNTNRHLCEFTGLDLEMPIDWHYGEVIQVVHETLLHICRGVESECSAELAVIRAMYPSEAPLVPSDGPCVVSWLEAMQLLAQQGIERDPMADLNTEEERKLGAIIREQRGADLFFLDRYPSAVRPFYTMPCREEPEYSNSYDCIFRGQEIGSGAQRCHDPALLEARCADLGVPTEPLQPYINSFRHGVPPHGGVGLGLERIVQLFLGLDNIRKAVMFTRDPVRLSP
jgi:aspartyl-tRNA synthetase